MRQRVRVDLILRQIAKRHIGKTSTLDDIFLTEVKNGKTMGNDELVRLDALAIRRSWSKPLLTGYEVKINRHDFLRDDKWPKYLDLCHEFYFVCPSGLISPEELPREVGLIWYNSDKDCISTKRKAVYRQIEVPVEMLWYLVMTRIKSDNQHPFFSSHREYLEAWLEDKKERKNLGKAVRNKTFNLIADLTEQVKNLERKLKHATEHAAQEKKILEQIKQLMVEAGYTSYQVNYHLPEIIEQLIKADLPRNLQEPILAILRAVEKLKPVIKSWE